MREKTKKILENHDHEERVDGWVLCPSGAQGGRNLREVLRTLVTGAVRGEKKMPRLYPPRAGGPSLA